ncbi:DUF5327 family protein [Anaerobacillus isosaccharinicus]|uniref:DUF5327 family protein n=1 Tax=Anaerobacillus isosaccharinicus TaxID=1532552 RepID=A0A1S2KYF0_9BACI|nr:DUF5327 family protein [Anaerobacillus isosaccharinicus]MBA5584304.1 DUF5327 family protein [Anaerobacillus isosaccharinicus]QOY37296.1 DUF5327 family protein [Anaerobacillus isosaccharinicus]
MNIGTEVIIKKLEERVQAVKKAISTNDKEKLTEDLISMKAYCDLLLEAQKDVKPMTETKIEKMSNEKNKTVVSDEPDSGSLFDF